MFLQLQHQSLSLGRRPLGFTQHYYTEWDDGIGKDRVAFFLILAVTSTQIPAEEMARDAFELLQDRFLEDLTGDPYDRFESSLREVNRMVATKERELEVKFLPNVHMIIGLLNKDVLFLSQHGEAQGYLLRKRHMSLITEGLSDDKNKEDLFQNIASGILEVGDNAIFSTGSLVQYVSPSDLAKIYSEQNLEAANTELKDLLKQDMEDQMAVLTLDVLEKTQWTQRTETETHRAVNRERLLQADAQTSSPAPLSLFEEEEETPSARRRRVFAEHRERLKAAVETLQKWDGFERNFAWLLRLRQWNQSKLLSAIFALGIFTVAALALFGYSLSQRQVLVNLEAKLTEASQNVAAAETKGGFNKDEAQVLLNNAEALAKEVLESGQMGAAASELLASVQEQRDFLDNVIRLDDELVLVADFSKDLSQGTSILGLEPSEDRWVIYSQDRAFQVLTDQVQTPVTIEAGEQVVAAHDMPDYNRVLMLTLAGKLLEFTQGNTQFADTADGTWHEGVDIGTFSSKVYILDPASNQIWKYQKGNEAYSAASAYLSGAVDLSQAVSMAIDGKVWVLNQNGTLLQFLSGKAVEFKIKKAPVSGLTSASRVYTESEISQLYILDAAQRRLLVFDKNIKNDDLTYASQFVFDSLDEDEILTDVYLDKARNVVMLTTTHGLYEMRGLND